MYSIGDRLVHPSYGAGELKSIEEVADHFDINAPKMKYYVLEMVLNKEKVMVPVQKADEIGIRPVITREQVTEIKELLMTEPDSVVENWGLRHHDNLEKIKSGDINALAEVIRDLYTRNMKKGLSSRERKMLINAKRILLSEISMVLEEDYRDLENKLRDFFSDSSQG